MTKKKDIVLEVLVLIHLVLLVQALVLLALLNPPDHQAAVPENPNVPDPVINAKLILTKFMNFTNTNY